MPEDLDLDAQALLKQLGMRIRHVRKEQKLSIRDMVLKHGYHDSQWRRYEQGGGGAISITSLLKIARSLGTSLSILLDGVGEYEAEAVGQIRTSKAATKATGEPAPAATKDTRPVK